MNYTELAKKYLNIFEQHKDSSEENISFHLIEPLLKELGFQEQWFMKQVRTHNKTRHYADIIIQDSLIIETKKGTKTIDEIDIDQLDRYLETKRISLGILTNGIEWILIDNSIKWFNNKTEKIVCKVKLDHKKSGELHPNNLEYFTYNFLLNNGGLVKYFTLVQQVYTNLLYGEPPLAPISCKKYRSAGQVFMKYIAEQHGSNYRLDLLQPSEFCQYLRWHSQRKTHKSKEGQRTLSKTYIQTQYNYVKKIYTVAKQEGLLPFNPLEDIKRDYILRELKDIITETKDVCDENFPLIINNTYKSFEKDRNPLRNTVIFSLILFGIRRDEIAKLKIIDFKKDIKEPYIVIRNKKGIKRLKLPTKVVNQIIQFHNTLEEKRVKTEWLLCGSKGKRLNPSTITEIINDYLRLHSKYLTVEKVQKYIQKELLRNTKDLISLMYLTGLNANNLIDEHEIEDLANIDKLLHKHPIKVFLDNI